MAPRDLILAGALALVACSGGENIAPIPGEPPCASPSLAMQFPTPYWRQTAAAGREVLAAPEGDAIAAAASVDRAAWVDELGAIDGVAARPTFFVALDGAASSVDASALAVVDLGDVPTAVDVAFDAHLDETGTTLVARPEDPLPPAVARDRALVIGSSAVVGAAPIRSCPPDGAEVTDAYDEALEAARAIASDAVLAVPFRSTERQAIHRQLAEALVAESAAKVVEAATVPLADLDAFAPESDVAALLVDPAPRGILETPLYLDDGQRITDDPDTLAPVAHAVTRPGFVVVLPKAARRPVPWVLFQHGGGGDKRQAFRIARPFVEAGIAIVGVDLLYHGDRAEKPGGGSGAEYIDFIDPLRMRDLFVQTSADHLAVVAGVGALNEALAPITGDAETLDPERVFYVGHSLGALSGGMTVGAGPALLGGALFNGGGGWEDIARGGYFGAIVLGSLRKRPELTQDAVMHLGQTLIDGADPLAFASRFEVAANRTVLVLEAIDEALMENATTDHLARAWGADLALPAHHAVDGLAERDLPLSGKRVRMLVQFPMSDLEPSQRHGALIERPAALSLVATCFAGLAEGSGCTVEDTGFGR